jgi:tetratricopeptide (TPR) repeat protein
MAFSSGTALAARKKPVVKGKGGGKSGKKGVPGGAAKAPSAEKKGAASRHPAPPGRKSRLPEGWPEWRFPPMAHFIEEERQAASRLAERGLFWQAALAWDGVRALARLAYGPGDLRPWAALARSARSLLEYAGQARSRNNSGQASLVPEPDRLAGGAASISRGAVRGIADCAGYGDGGSCPVAENVLEDEIAFASRTADAAVERPGPESGQGGGREGGDGGAWPGGSGREGGDGRNYEANGKSGEDGASAGSGKDGKTRARPADGEFKTSLSAALYPVPEHVEETLPWPTPDDLRLRLAAGEGPEGPRPSMREALRLTFLLGKELFEGGNPAHAEEAQELLRKASEGMDALLGPADEEALETKIMWAQCLAGLPGDGRLRFPSAFSSGSLRDRLSAAETLLREASLLAVGLPGETGRLFRFLARIARAAVLIKLENFEMGYAEAYGAMEEACGDRKEGFATTPAMTFSFLFEAGELYRLTGQVKLSRDNHCRALSFRRDFLGWSHPETALSLALLGDLDYNSERLNSCLAFWALALEALEDGGELFERERAELEFRVGCRLMPNGSLPESLQLLEKALSRAAAATGETSRLTLECLLTVSFARKHSGFPGASEEGFRKAVRLLEDMLARPLSRFEANEHAEFLTIAHMGLAYALYDLGDLPAAAEASSEALRKYDTLQMSLPDSSGLRGFALDAIRTLPTLGELNAAAGLNPKGGPLGGPKSGREG